MSNVEELIEDVVVANHVLVSQRVVDAFGHVSARIGDRDRYLMARSMAPALVEKSDVLEHDLDGNAVDDPRARLYLERFIHGEIYRRRPDVMAVVHSHSHSVVPFSVSEQPLLPVCHMGGFIPQGTPVFEIRDVVGEGSDLLVRDQACGAALAQSLGSAPLVLMRGHGSTVVGASLRQAVFRAVYAEINARVQIAALQLGDVKYLNEAEAKGAAAANDSQIDRAWQIWKRSAEKSDLL